MLSHNCSCSRYDVDSKKKHHDLKRHVSISFPGLSSYAPPHCLTECLIYLLANDLTHTPVLSYTLSYCVCVSSCIIIMVTRLKAVLCTEFKIIKIFMSKQHSHNRSPNQCHIHWLFSQKFLWTHTLTTSMLYL